MSIRLMGIAIMLAIFLCAPAVSAFDEKGPNHRSMISENWGQSFRAAREAQIVNPDAGKVAGPVEGFNGKAAEKTMEAYYESFSKETQREAYTMDSFTMGMGK
jgi:hypothetical protein